MNTILNIIWLFCGGISTALGWLVSGVLCFIFIVTIPFSGACFELAGLTLMPFGKAVAERQHLESELKPKPVASTLWIIFAGIWLYISYILSGIVMICTVIGIPMGLQCFKIAQVALNPYKYTLIDKKTLDIIKK